MSIVKVEAANPPFGADHLKKRYEDLLADPEIDAVYIPLPNALHCEWTVRAAQAGKHVLCEKPLARRAEDAEHMAAACRAAGVVLMEAFMWRHHPQHARVRALLDLNTIGQPTFGFLAFPPLRGQAKLQCFQCPGMFAR